MLYRKYFAKFKLHLGDGWRAINDDSTSAYGYYLYDDTNGFNLIDYLDYRTFNNPIDYFLIRIYISSGTNDVTSASDSVKNVYYPLGFKNLKDIADPNDPAIGELDCMLLSSYVGE